MHALSLGLYFRDGHISREGANHSRHSHDSNHAHRSEEHHYSQRPAVQETRGKNLTGGVDNQGSVKQILVSQVRVGLSQSLDLRQSSVSVAGATPDEQAGSDLAGTVGSALNALNTSGVSPGDAVTAVNDTANAAIQQTSQDLAAGSGGGSSAALADAVAQIQGQLQSLFSVYLDQAGGPQGAASATATGAQISSKANGLLEIHTREGDTITLSFASKNGASVQNLQAGSGGIQFSGSQFQIFSQNRVTISVEGDLNANELQAVRDLVGQVNQLADGFFGGDVNAALFQAGSLSFDGTQLSDYSLHLALKQTFEAYGLKLAGAAPVVADQAPAAVNDAAATAAPSTAGVVSDTSAMASPATVVGDAKTAAAA